MADLSIAGRILGPGRKPYVIAEVSGNHNGSLDRALQIVDAIAASGADAVKLQTYTADTMTLNLSRGEFFIEDPKSLWTGKSLYDLYNEAHTPWEWHAPIFERARHHGLAAFSTPFDRTAVDFLETLNVPCYKVASFENTDLPLIRAVAETGKPVIISTGMATISEIEEAVMTARAAGCKDLVLLKCTSTYPAAPEDSNLASIPRLRELFNCEVGISDHTLGIGAALAATTLGATVIEKHVTLLRAEGGVDSAFSLEPAELAALVREAETASRSVGVVRFGPTHAELPSLRFRRTLYITANLRRGDRLDANNFRAIRPGLGLPVKYHDLLLGKRLVRDAAQGTPLSWDLVE